MHEMSPHSPNASTTLPISSTVTSPAFSVQQQHTFHHQTLANRPLPLSPTSEPMPPQQQLQQQPLQAAAMEEVFTPPVASHPPPMTRKLTHPGPLPMLEESVEQTGFAPISRTLTEPSLGSVFSPVSSASAPGPASHHIQHTPPGQQPQAQFVVQQQQQQQQQQRGRSNTLPSPYEVPDTNGNTLPHDAHIRTTHQHRGNNARGVVPPGVVGGATAFPPPPLHSPPPFTHSATDITHLSDEGHTHMPHPYQQQQQGGARQNTLPRTVPNQRSLSTSAAVQGRTVAAANKGLSHMRSDGNIHDIHEPIKDDLGYSHPPMDSDPEPSIVSTSSYGQGSEVMMGGGPGMERGRQPYNPHQHHHHYHPQQQQQQQQQQSRHPGMLNGALTGSTSADHFAPPGEGPIPLTSGYPLMSQTSRDAKRESLFSETSTELSVSSNSGDPMPPQFRTGPGGGRGGAGRKPVFSESDTSVSSGNMEKESSPGEADLSLAVLL